MLKRERFSRESVVDNGVCVLVVVLVYVHSRVHISIVSSGDIVVCGSFSCSSRCERKKCERDGNYA